MPSPEDLSLARRVVEQGVCQRAEVKLCLDQQRSSEKVGKLEILADLLIEKGYATRTQIERMKLVESTSEAKAEPTTQRIGHYELLLKLGEGGMGAVYKANDTRNGKIVAIKVLPRSKAKDDLFLKRFEMEARATFELDHPNIVHGYDVGNADGYHFLVIEFVQGYDLCALLEQRGRFPEAEALNILEQMAKALDHIHTEHLVHRDIKPENILIGEDGVAKLTDMGLTVDDPAKGRRRRLTEAGIAMGTPFYLSPEQIKGESDVDIRSDIYALGATTYEMVTGRPPFEGDTPAIVMMKHLNDTVPSPHDLDRTISINFCHLLERMMAKDPFHRYQTPYEMLQDVRRVLRGKQPVGIRPPAGRSSVARPQLHQHSQRLKPIDINAPEHRDRDSSASTPLPTIGKPLGTGSPSSALLPAVGDVTSSAAKSPALTSGVKQLAPGPTAPGLRRTTLRKMNTAQGSLPLPVWLRIVLAVMLLGLLIYGVNEFVLKDKEKKTAPPEKATH
ncbi:MAG: protein kinase [Planctomycetota bacterium]